MPRPATMTRRELDGRPVIIGGGIAGMMAALTARRPCTLVISGPVETTTSSYLAQGGMAACVGSDDSLEQHIADTVTAGAGLCDVEAVRSILSETEDVVCALEKYNVAFARNADGGYDLHREAAHGRHRILHAHGDGTGRAIMEALRHAVMQSSAVTCLYGPELSDIASQDGRVAGVTLSDRSWIETSACVMATGGAAGLHPVSTNPANHTGAPISIAMRAGAAVMDLEFMQFHPTALAVGPKAGRYTLVSEAVRGAGAQLVDQTGTAFTDPLLSRDRVARAVAAQIQAGKTAYLDARGLFQDGFGQHFPSIDRACRACGIDPDRQLVPVTPAAHYMMGGLKTDLSGQTTLEGLWACGEVAATGLHGANRLASNSLLEACVMGARVGRALHGTILKPVRGLQGRDGIRRSPFQDYRSDVGRYLGLLRNGPDLAEAYNLFAPHIIEDDHALIAAAMAFSALQRTESRGSHFRTDARPSGEARHNVLLLSDLPVSC